jgi:hypothetical protein
VKRHSIQALFGFDPNILQQKKFEDLTDLAYQRAEVLSHKAKLDSLNKKHIQNLLFASSAMCKVVYAFVVTLFARMGES